jgi:hypothetical protein
MAFANIKEIKEARLKGVHNRLDSIQKNKTATFAKAKEIFDWLNDYKKNMGKSFEAGVDRNSSVSFSMKKDDMKKENLPDSESYTTLEFDPFSIGFHVPFPEIKPENSYRNQPFVFLKFKDSKPRICVAESQFHVKSFVYACLDGDGNISESESVAEYFKKNKFPRSMVKNAKNDEERLKKSAIRLNCFFKPTLENCAPKSTASEITQEDEDWIAYVDIFNKTLVPGIHDKFKEVTREKLEMMKLEK